MHRGRGTPQPTSFARKMWAQPRGSAAGRERGERNAEPVAYRDRVSSDPCTTRRDRINATYLCSSTITAPHTLLCILPFHSSLAVADVFVLVSPPSCVHCQAPDVPGAACLSLQMRALFAYGRSECLVHSQDSRSKLRLVSQGQVRT